MSSSWKRGSVAAMVLACVAFGCGQKKEKSAADAGNQAGTLSAAADNSGAPAAQAIPAGGNASQALPVGPPPMPQAPAQPIAIAADANSGAVLDQLTQALRKYSMEKRRVPATIGEVISAGYVSGLPQPPPGKQYAIDKKQVSVVLVSK